MRYTAASCAGLRTGIATADGLPFAVWHSIANASPSPCQVRGMTRNVAHQRQTTTNVCAGQSRFRARDQHLRGPLKRPYKAEDGGSSPSAPTIGDTILGSCYAFRASLAAPRSARGPWDASAGFWAGCGPKLRALRQCSAALTASIEWVSPSSSASLACSVVAFCW